MIAVINGGPKSLTTRIGNLKVNPREKLWGRTKMGPNYVNLVGEMGRNYRIEKARRLYGVIVQYVAVISPLKLYLIVRVSWRMSRGYNRKILDLTLTLNVTNSQEKRKIYF